MLELVHIARDRNNDIYPSVCICKWYSVYMVQCVECVCAECKSVYTICISSHMAVDVVSGECGLSHCRRLEVGSSGVLHACIDIHTYMHTALRMYSVTQYRIVQVCIVQFNTAQYCLAHSSTVFVYHTVHFHMRTVQNSTVQSSAVECSAEIVQCTEIYLFCKMCSEQRKCNEPNCNQDRPTSQHICVQVTYLV